MPFRSDSRANEAPRHPRPADREHPPRAHRLRGCLWHLRRGDGRTGGADQPFHAQLLDQGLHRRRDHAAAYAGKVSLDASAATYLDDLPPAWRSITVREVLPQVSGLPDILDLPDGQGTGTLVGSGGEASA